MTFPTPYTLLRRPYVESEDALGNTEPDWGPPVEVAVIQIEPHVVEQGSATMAEAAVADLDVSVPHGTTVSLKDRFVVDGEDYEVVGIQDFTKGFHGWKPGIVIELRRVT